MTKREFLFHLNGASFVAFKFAEKFVKNKLVTDFKYNLILTVASNIDGSNKFDIFPEDNDIIKLDLTDNEVVDILYRNNKIPVWIDISVLKSSRKTTTFNYYVQANTMMTRMNTIITIMALVHLELKVLSFQ